MSPLKWEQRSRRSITFLFTSEGYEAIWELWILLFWTSGFLTRPDINSHRQGLVWDFASVPWSFLTRPDANSHRHSPTAGSDICGLGKGHGDSVTSAVVECSWDPPFMSLTFHNIAPTCDHLSLLLPLCPLCLYSTLSILCSVLFHSVLCTLEQSFSPILLLSIIHSMVLCVSYWTFSAFPSLSTSQGHYSPTVLVLMLAFGGCH
jgi:hypothetical protein